jgi:hypothetical protein
MHYRRSQTLSAGAVEMPIWEFPFNYRPKRTGISVAGTSATLRVR